MLDYIFRRPIVALVATALVLAAFAAALLLQSAGAVPGDTAADRVFGQNGSFTTNSLSVGESGLWQPWAVTVDGAGNVYVADTYNHRVLEYDTPLTTDTVADRVFGQPDYASRDCNNGGVSANSLCNPTGVAVDAAGNLYVADQENHRVLGYDSPLTTDTVADRVFGQPGPTDNTSNNGGISASSLNKPSGVTVDDAGHLYVADQQNNRVLRYDNPLGSRLAGDVFGQPGFATGFVNHGGTSGIGLHKPAAVAVDGAGHLYIADQMNSRVLEYDNTLTTNNVADRVFGQPTLSGCCANNGGISATSLFSPSGVAVDGAGHLYIADLANNRVLKFDDPLTSQVASSVFGQPGFTTNTCNNGGVLGTSATGLCFPVGVAVDAADNLYIAEDSNSRVLEFDATPPIVPGDTDCDGDADETDALNILAYVADVADETECWDRADANGDTIVDVLDALSILTSSAA